MDFASAAWQEWLGCVPSFAFQSKDGHRFTALKEIRARGGTYWVAYRKVGGKLTHTYLGRPEDLTLACLEQVASSLAEQASQEADGPPVKAQQTRQEAQIRMEWQDQLLATKFFVPVAPHTLIARPRLFSLLDEGRLRSLTLVSAPVSVWFITAPPANKPGCGSRGCLSVSRSAIGPLLSPPGPTGGRLRPPALQRVTATATTR